MDTSPHTAAAAAPTHRTRTAASVGRGSAVRTVGLLALVALLVAALHALGADPAFRIDWTDPPGWLRATEPAEAVLAVARAGALVAAYRGLVPAVVYALLLLVRARAAAAAVRSAVPRRLRPAIDRLAAVSGAAAIAISAGSAAAMPAYPPRPGTVPSTEGAVVTSPIRNETTGRAASSAHAPRPGEHVVQPGEHLWSIAAQEVARRSGREIDDLAPDDVAPYWRRVVAANRGRLRSGDPDLVHPGERVVLPVDRA